MSTGVLKERIQNVFNAKTMNFQLVWSDILLYYFRTDLFPLADQGFSRLSGVGGGGEPISKIGHQPIIWPNFS